MDTLTIFYLYAFLQGCIFGSFTNVLVDRLPHGMSILGRSHCDICKRTLTSRELVPIISYLFQGAKSSCCRQHLKIQYPAVELLMGILFLTITHLYLTSIQGIITFHHLGIAIILWIIMVVTVAISMIDLRHHIIPDMLQVALVIIALIYQYALGTLSVMTIAEGFVVTLPILCLYLVTRGRGMGFGDVKLEVGLGMWLGVTRGFLGIYAGFVLGAFFGIVLMIIHRARRRSHIAFGPFLLMGAWMAFFYGDFLLNWYLTVFQLQ